MAPTPDSRPSPVAAVCVDVAAVMEREPCELAALARDDLVTMSASEAEVVVVATQRLSNALAAVQVAAVTTYADRVDEDPDRYREERRREFEERRDAALLTGRDFTERWFPIPGEQAFAAALAPLLRLSPRRMSTRINRARRMGHEMPGTWASARGGDLGPYRAEAIVRAGSPLHEGRLEEFEARAAVRARRKRGVACRRDRQHGRLPSRPLPVPARPAPRGVLSVSRLQHAGGAHPARPRHPLARRAHRGHQPRVLCTTHHGFKHHAGRRLAMTLDGLCTWTTPTGRTHTTRPRAVHSPSV